MIQRIGLLVFMLIAYCYGFPEEENTYDPDLFEGDMRLSPIQRLLAETGGDVSQAGTDGLTFGSAKDINKLWLPERRVPYTITKELAANAKATFEIMRAMKEWESHTCLTFVERTVERNYIEFFNNCSGCWSYVGRVGGKQNICLSSGCWGIGTIAHEIDKKHNFRKYDNTIVDSLGTKYDYISVMQYSKTAFGNGKVTMDPKQDVIQLGQRVGFSAIDSVQANMLYQCNGATTRPFTMPPKNVLTGPNDCDFDKNFCHFVQDKTDDFDFSLRIGSTPSWGTGPDVDHTTGRMGAYAFIEASSPRSKGNKARLISKQFPASAKGMCMRFYYHMMSSSVSSMGTLNVYMGSSILFTKTYSQGSQWKQADIDLKSDKPFQVTFEAVRGSGYQGDISIDDVTFMDGACASQPPPAPVPQPPPVVEEKESTVPNGRVLVFATMPKGTCALFAPKPVHSVELQMDEKSS
eukprot:gene15011-16560_t